MAARFFVLSSLISTALCSVTIESHEKSMTFEWHDILFNPKSPITITADKNGQPIFKSEVVTVTIKGIDGIGAVSLKEEDSKLVFVGGDGEQRQVSAAHLQKKMNDEDAKVQIVTPGGSNELRKWLGLVYTLGSHGYNLENNKPPPKVPVRGNHYLISYKTYARGPADRLMKGTLENIWVQFVKEQLDSRGDVQYKFKKCSTPEKKYKKIFGGLGGMSTKTYVYAPHTSDKPILLTPVEFTQTVKKCFEDPGFMNSNKEKENPVEVKNVNLGSAARADGDEEFYVYEEYEDENEDEND